MLRVSQEDLVTPIPINDENTQPPSDNDAKWLQDHDEDVLANRARRDQNGQVINRKGRQTTHGKAEESCIEKGMQKLIKHYAQGKLPTIQDIIHYLTAYQTIFPH